MRQSLIKYLRHTNGRGKLYDDSDVSRLAYLSSDSIASGSCIIRGGRILNYSLVTDNAMFISGTAELSIIRQFAQIYDNPTLLGPVIVEGSARVYGDAVIDGRNGIIRLYGKMRINSGYWTRAPRYIDLGFESVTESKKGCMVGCRDRSADYWLRHGPKLGKRWGMTDEQIEALLMSVRNVCQ